MTPQTRISRAEIRLEKLQLSNGLVVDHLEASADDLTIRQDPVSASLEAPGTVKATLSEGTLTEFLNEQLPAAVRKVEVQCVGGRLQIAAIAKVIFEVKVLALCRLEIVDGKQIFARLESVDPGGPIRSLIESQIERVNPVFNADDLPIPVSLVSTQVEAGTLTVNGTFNLKP